MDKDQEVLLKLVILDQTLNTGRRALIDTAGTSHMLPEVTVRRFTRTAHSATVAAREKYGLELFVITEVFAEPEIDDAREIADWTLICRLQDAGAALPDHLQWNPPSQAQLGLPDRLALDAAMREFEIYDSGTKASSFGRYSSLDELRAWYAPYLEKLGARESGIQQWNADPWFALFRLSLEPIGEASPGTPKALWFKAVGEPNTREFAVTQALTQECPHWFPRIIAAKPEWHGWLMEEVNGGELDDEAERRPWALTARILAKVQKRFVGQDERLLALGCRDWRMPRVLASLDPFFEDMEEIMQRQPASPPRILDRSELRDLKIRCRELCHRVEDVDIPYTIAHGDFSPHNVIVSNGWPLLIDWAEAYLSFPFISWAYYWHRMLKHHPEQAVWHEPMHRNYAYRVWAPMLGRSRVDEGMKLAPALAALILALYGIDDPVQRRNRNADRSKRSLVRLVHRELETLRQATAEPVGAL